MRYLSLLVCIVMFPMFMQGQISRQEYISRWQLVAIEEMNQSGIPASIKMAQACLESGNGNSELSRRSNNHFGIKCKKSWKGKRVYYDDDRKNECFRKYRNAEESFKDHTDFLMSNPRYASLFDLHPGDYKGWARGLKKAGYATAHDYHKRLIRIIEENKLYRLDKKMNYRQLIALEHAENKNNDNTSGLSLNPFSSHKIIRTNGIKSVVANKGDTFEMLAQELGLNDWELYKFNDRSPGYQPVPNEVIYIQPKKRKADKKQSTHIAQSGESMHYISQIYGLKLKPLYRRNRMKQGQMPKIGQVIHLRNRK